MYFINCYQNALTFPTIYDLVLITSATKQMRPNGRGGLLGPLLNQIGVWRRFFKWSSVAEKSYCISRDKLIYVVSGVAKGGGGRGGPPRAARARGRHF